MPRSRATLGVLWVAIATTGCRVGASGGGVDPSTPVAEAYAKASDFAGEWVGESNGVLGALAVKSLSMKDTVGPRRYYGKFVGDDGVTSFVINMQQPLVTVGEQGIAGNLARFTWQDGRGGQGDGWVLINPEDSALTGEIRVGNGGQALDFVRVDDG